MTIADAIALWLAEKEITHAFGIVGGGNVVLWDAIARKGYTQIVCMHHEQAAVMAAAYFCRAGSQLAAALCTTGAGSTNAITGAVAAFMDSIPVLILSGNEASKYLEAPTRVLGVQGYRSSDLMKPMAKYAARATAHDWRIHLDWAHAQALKARQGPVWIDIPKDVQNALV